MPTSHQVFVSGAWVWEVSGLGITVHHQQRCQAQLMWHCQAVARGYDGPAPVVRP